MAGLEVSIRPFTYPYDAAMSICSDLDETPDKNAYLEIMRFLNTDEQKSLGQGVGLEVGNSIYFDMPDDQFAYWNTDDAGRDMVRTLIKSGHIDCLHSFGDLAETRQHAIRAIDELEKHDCRLEVWVDHRKSPTNFGHDITAGSGDITGSKSYHADISAKFGIKYVWRGRTTGLIGQNAPVNPLLFAKMFEPRSPLISGKTLSKEAVKVLLGYFNRPRWQMHALNSVYRLNTLRDGHKIFEFLRSDPYYGGQSKVDRGELIDRVLTKRNLDMLLKRKAVWIHYTHLGKISNFHIPLDKSVRDAFVLLAEYHNSGRILVVTTQRLLRYLVTRNHLRYRTDEVQNALHITIEAIDDPIEGTRLPSLEELQGITFVVDGVRPVELSLKDNSNKIESKIETCDGKTFASVPWRSLNFPDLR